MSKQVNLSTFFTDDYISFSVYDNVRKIGNYIDGQKNASRKILHTVLQQNIDKFIKVSNLGPKVQDFAQYLHGSLDDVVVNMTADYVGSNNNMPLLEGDGNFGSTFIPEASATRYIFARMSPKLKTIFNSDDYVNLTEQSFEGDQIEPKYYVPTIPLIAINGSEGVSIGFAQKIFPRNPAEIIKWVQQRADGIPPEEIKVDLTPYWNNMKCVVFPGDLHTQWLISGTFKWKTKYRIIVDSLPIGYTLKQYQGILDKLVEDKIIKDYDDLSDNDIFEFEIYVDSEFGKLSNTEILTKLKLIKKVSENFTCIDENNKIIIFDRIEDLLEQWYKKRIEYNELRKIYILAKIQKDIDNAQLKATFIQGVVDGKIELRNNKEEIIVKQAEQYSSLLENKVLKFLNLPIKVLTQEEIDKLNTLIHELGAKFAIYSNYTSENILLEDLKILNT